MKTQPTVLIADDEAEVRNVIQRFLARRGYEPILACDGNDALGKAKDRKPDIVLLDINMPGSDGLTVCRKLREDPGTRLIPVLMLTARASTEDKVMGLNGGADDYLLKPFELSELQARIDVLLRRNLQMISVNPLTLLPGNPSIEEELARRIKTGRKFGAAYIDVDNFKAYNDVYGFHQGDLLIVWLAKIIREAMKISRASGLDDSPFLGHVGGDDFIGVADAEVLPELCASIARTFDQGRSLWYTWWHMQKGCITTRDRRGKTRRFPLMTLTIATATNEKRKIEHVAQIAQITSEIKGFGKRRADQSKSFVLSDRRTD